MVFPALDATAQIAALTVVKADDVIISDIVAREEPYAIIIPTFQKAEYHS